MSDPNVDLARGAYDAFARGDVPGLLASLAEDVDWNVPAVLPHGMKAHGREEVGRFFEGLGATWSDFQVEVDDFVGSDDRVCVIGRARGRLDGSDTGYGFVHSWTVRNGALARFDEYVDPEPELLTR
jgi:uncharacterized protein